MTRSLFRTDEETLRPGCYNPFAEKEFQIALLEAFDLVECSLQTGPEDILTGLARDEFQPMPTQRVDCRCGLTGGILKRIDGQRRFVGLQTGKLSFRPAVRHRTGRRFGHLPGTDVRHRIVTQRHRSVFDRIKGLVAQRSHHTEVLLCIPRIGTTQNHLLAYREINRERRARIGHNRTAILRIDPRTGHVTIGLGHCAAERREEQSSHEE